MGIPVDTVIPHRSVQALRQAGIKDPHSGTPATGTSTDSVSIAATQRGDATPYAGSGTPIPSPLAAKVVSLDVQPGAAVKEGDQVMTVEAMKMNTVIYAPANGTVTSFAVKPGDTVTEGQTLAYIG